jgi:cytochrome bd-type quinol oxidase subunit 2
VATEHSTSSTANGEEQLVLTGKVRSLYGSATVIGYVGIVAAFLLGFLLDQKDGHFQLRRFFFAYLVSFMYFLSLSLGGLFFVILQHVTKAGWSVNVRRIAEWLAAAMPWLAAMSVPIVGVVVVHSGVLYRWADPKYGHEATAEVSTAAPAGEVSTTTPSASTESTANPKAEDEPLTGFKKLYLNPYFWSLRIAVYFAIWSAIGLWYWRLSVLQDTTGDIALTTKMEMFAPVAMILFALTLTGAAFDFLMALDPNWASTIYGVYYFAGCAIAVFATIVVIARLLQRHGFLQESVTTEHFHDLGKFLFGFTFFWGYIAFSQYMLQWYANLPEEREWYRHHGATTAWATTNWYSLVIVAILFGHLLIPFAGLLSRHVKRNVKSLEFWAIWLLVFHWIDIFWNVMPEKDAPYLRRDFHFGIPEVAAFVGIGGLWVACIVKRATRGALRPLRDPRLGVSMSFENV